MLNGQRFAFTERIDSLGRSSILPYLPITLSSGSNSLEMIFRHELAFEICPREK